MTTIMAYKSAIFVFINLFTIVYSQLQYKIFENKTECKETGNYFQYYQTSTLKCVKCPNASSVMTVSSDGKNHAQTGRININMTNLLLITTEWLFFHRKCNLTVVNKRVKVTVYYTLITALSNVRFHFQDGKGGGGKRFLTTIYKITVCIPYFPTL